MLLSQPFTKTDHEQNFLSVEDVTRTYMEECIHREQEARETLNNVQARGYSIEWLRLLAQVLCAEEIIDSIFFNTYTSDLDELNKHQAREDEFAMAKEAELDPQIAEELRGFLNAKDPQAAQNSSML